MNNSAALLYNFSDEKLKMVKMVCMMMQVRFKEVAVEEYDLTLGQLLGLKDIVAAGTDDAEAELTEAMLVLNGFDGGKLQMFLQALQRVGVGRIDLKAMLTEHNKNWSGRALYAELCREREEFKKMEAAKYNK